MIRISKYQLFASIVLFQIGTTIIFGFSSEAGRDAWIAALLSTVAGCCFIFLVSVMMRLQPGLTLVQWFPTQFGLGLGVPLAWLYPLLFIYVAGRIIGDIRFFVNMMMLPGTPVWAVIVPLMLVVSYILFSGLEVLCRIASILFPIILILFILEIMLLNGAKILHLDYLRPIMGAGWERVWDQWQLGISQTFGESILFAMFWTNLNTKDRKKLPKVMVIATLFTGVLISIMNLMNVMALGESVLQRSVFPNLTVLRLVSVADFLENLDALGMMYFTVTAFLKISFYLMAAVMAVKQLTLAKSNGLIIILVTSIASVMGLTMASNLSEHLEVAFNNFPRYLWLPLTIYLPLLLLIVAGIRTKWKKGQPFLPERQQQQ
ncbi:GerAB/ArcD/ProY family transporter [Cohnella cholangitidis]|uniref:GerAB/ArcD/ProY family transporter n=1 Tax=Cohnella cholangitidis TaxID=2598458 RepID=A0A7G5C1I8_9BACL|nr:endospore germination permease [Cohnella cholangitidis]QMV43072.1 GerAB/ArcD/ProY family transporter [Cohnella cholangitidis]